MEKLFLLDVSGFLFRAYFALPRLTNPEGESTHALYGFIRSIQKLLNSYSPDHLAAVFDGPDNKRSRTERYADYKIHRRPTPDDLPQQIVWADQFCQLSGIPRLCLPGVEADDAIGTIAKWAEKKGSHVYIVSSDKDLAQLVTDQVSLINPFKENLLIDPKKVEELYGIPPEKIVDYLAIMGDSSDNIPGLSGFGPKTAVTLLQQFDSLEELLAHPDQVAGKQKQETLRQEADIARLSKELATIDCNLDCPREVKFYQQEAANESELRHFYEKMGFKSLLKDLGSGPTSTETLSYKIVDTEADLDQLIEELSKAKEVCFDTETTSPHPLEAKLVGIGFSIRPQEAWYLPANGKLGLEQIVKRLTPLFANPNIGFFGHNVKYDIHVLNHIGIKVAKISFDTILASYLLNAHERRHSLDQLALAYFSKVKIPIKELIGSGKKEITLAEVAIERVAEYCCEDADYTLRLRKLLAQKLDERGLTHLLYEIELPLMQVLVKMEQSGIYVSRERLGDLSTYLQSEIAILEKEIHQLAGESFAINSPKQLSEILYTKLKVPPPKKKGGHLSTAADLLEELEERYPIAGKILQYRTLEKLRSTYVDTLPTQILPSTGRIHCTFNQSVAATGRLSCQEPNLQNIPVRTPLGREIRAAFCPEKEGWSFLSADYSQIELRLMAHLSEEPALIHAFEKGLDVHKATAATVFSIPLEEVTPSQRAQAKTVNFGILYGQQAFGLARELHISAKEATAFINAYFEKYPKVRQFIDQAIERARQEGRATTLTGRERLIPDISDRNAIQRAAAERLAINTPLQGMTADIIKMAMIEIDREIEQRGWKAKMLLQIHDELFFELPDEEISAVQQVVKGVMEGIYPLRVPLVVDLSVGKNWKEC